MVLDAEPAIGMPPPKKCIFLAVALTSLTFLSQNLISSSLYQTAPKLVKFGEIPTIGL